MCSIMKGLKRLARSGREHAQLDGMMRGVSQVATYRLAMFSAILQDGEMSALLGLLYIHHHSQIFPDLIPGHLLRAAHRILHDPDGLQHARSFLSDPSQTKLIEDALLSDAFAERASMDIDAEGLSEQARLVHDKIVAAGLGIVFHPAVRHSYPGLSDSELKLLLEAIKSEPIVEELLIPRQMSSFLSHQEKVEDACEHARLLLRKADANLFYGCSFKYTELDAALGGSPSHKRKLRESDQLLWLMLRNPSQTDKQFRGSYLAQDAKPSPKNLQVLHPEHFPSTVPHQFQGEFSVEHLRVLRIHPATWRMDPMKGTPVALAYSFMADCKESLGFTRWEPRARQRVCQAHRLIDKVSPSPREVYEVMAQSALEGVGSVQRTLKRSRDRDTGSFDPEPETKGAKPRIKKKKKAKKLSEGEAQGYSGIR